MMESPYYDRLQAVAELSLEDSAELNRYKQMAQGVEAVRVGLRNFVETIPEVLQGKAGDAIAGAAVSMMNDISAKESNVIVKGVQYHEIARSAMREAKEDFADLSEDLVSPKFAAVIKTAGTVVLPGVGTVLAEVYLNHLAQDNNEQREQAARQILVEMEGKIKTVSELPMPQVVPVQWQDSSDSKWAPLPDPWKEGSSAGASSGAGSGGGLGSSGSSSGSGLPSGGLADWLAGPMFPDSSSGSGFVPVQDSIGAMHSIETKLVEVVSRSPEPVLSFMTPELGLIGSSELGSDKYCSGLPAAPGLGTSSTGSLGSGSSSSGGGGSSVGVSSGSGSSDGSSSGGASLGVVPVVVTLPNGSTVGVVPASVVDSNASSWKAGYSTVPVSNVQPGGSLSMSGWAGTNPGGMGSGVGGIGGSGQFGSSVGGIGGAGSGAGGIGGIGGIGGPGQLGSSVDSAGGGAMGVRTAGTVGAGGTGAAGAAGEAGAAGAGSRGGMMSPGVGGGSSQDEKLRRRKYKVLKFRADRDPEDWGELPPGAGAGRAEDLPVRRAPEDEEYPW